MSIFVIDTSVLLDNPRCLFNLSGNIVIPFCVIQELDNNKTRKDGAGRNARESIRLIENLRRCGDLSIGVEFNGFSLRVLHNELKGVSPDDIIIDTAVKLKGNSKRKKITICSNDLALRIKASSLGLEVEELTEPTTLDIFSGVAELETTTGFINQLYSEGKIEAGKEHQKQFFSNQFIIMKCGQQSALTQFKDNKFILLSNHKHKIFDIDPKSKEQEFAFKLLMDQNIELVSMIGKAGVGKTFIALAAGLEQTLEQKIYDKIIVIRPIISVGASLGFLPGSLEEKLLPWTQPIIDNLTVLFDNNKQAVDRVMSDGTVEIEALSFIRGRSIPRSFIILDEAQNLSLSELKTVITRLGEGSKIVLCGDVDQIDNRSLDLFNNGLSQVLDRFKDQKLAGHITLIKGQRSNLASIASDIL